MQDWVKLFCSEDLFTSGTVGLCICEFIGVAGINVQLAVLLDKAFVWVDTFGCIPITFLHFHNNRSLSCKNIIFLIYINNACLLLNTCLL